MDRLAAAVDIQTPPEHAAFVNQPKFLANFCAISSVFGTGRR